MPNDPSPPILHRAALAAPHDTRLGRLVGGCSAAGLVVVFGYFLVYIFRRLGHDHFGDFPTFYHAGLDVLSGRDLYVPFAPGELAYVYPPMLAVLYVPLTKLSQLGAARAMLPVHLLCVLLALFIGARELMARFGIKPTAARLCAVAFAAALLAENDLRSELQALETDVFMLLAFVLALRWLDRRPVAAGAALAFALNIKYLSIVFVPYLILRRRWRTLAGLVVWTIVFGLLPALALGWHENLRCLGVALRGLIGWVGQSPGAQPAANVHHLSDLVSVSVTSAIARHLRDSGRPESMALLWSAGIGFVLLLGAAVLYRVKRLPLLAWPAADGQQAEPYRGLVGLEWVGVMTVMLAFSPNTNTRHLSMALILYVAAAALLTAGPAVARALLIAGMATMFVGFLLPLPKLTGGPFAHRYFVLGVASWALLAMYATLLYAGLAWIARRRETEAAEPGRPPLRGTGF